MVLDASLLSTQHYKVRIKGKVEQSRKGVAPSPTHWCSSYRKGSLRVTLDYGRQLYFYCYLTSWKIFVPAFYPSYFIRRFVQIVLVCTVTLLISCTTFPLQLCRFFHYVCASLLYFKKYSKIAIYKDFILFSTSPTRVNPWQFGNFCFDIIGPFWHFLRCNENILWFLLLSPVHDISCTIYPISIQLLLFPFISRCIFFYCLSMSILLIL